MTTTPGPGRSSGPAPASVPVEPPGATPWAGPSPEQVRRWTAERELLARTDSAVASGRVRLLLWAGFVLTCLAVITLCVVAVFVVGGSFTPADDAATTSVAPAVPTASR